MKTLLLIGILLVCGLGLTEAQAAPPTSERVVLRLEPGKVQKARSEHRFSQADTIGVTAYVNGREMFNVNAGGSHVDLAGHGTYVAVNVIRNGPLAIKAVSLRKVRLVVYMEWGT